MATAQRVKPFPATCRDVHLLTSTERMSDPGAAALCHRKAHESVGFGGLKPTRRDFLFLGVQKRGSK